MAEPYYADARCKLYHGNALELLPQIASEADGGGVLITDPPWGKSNDNANAKRSRGHRPHDKLARALDFAEVIGDGEPFDPGPWVQAFPRSILWGANHYAASLPNSPFWLVWDRKAEGKAADSSVTDAELAWTSGTKYKTVRIYRQMWAGFQRDGSQAGAKHLHPMEKPVGLFRWCVGWFPTCKTVVDPFCGSGPCLLAAKREGLRAIGCEIVEEYCETTAKRLESEPVPIF